LAAVRTLFPDACPETEALSAAPNPVPLSSLGGCLVNELDAIDTSFVLVLDDYHRIARSSDVHGLVGFILDHPPRNLHLVLLTRSDPPLNLPGLRGSGGITEIRLQDLRFTESETTDLLSSTAKVTIGGGALRNLQRELEGWAVGLRLVSLAVRQVDDPDAFLNSLHGGIPHTQEYLLREVLTDRSPEVRRCLLKTSILDRFCGELIESVCAPDTSTDTPTLDGDEFVRLLRESNLFTIALDARGEWSRYHHLFQELLQRQLKQETTDDEMATLHLRASEWFETQGLVAESIGHALAADEVERAADCVERHRYEEMNADRWYVVDKWLARLPAEIKQERPGLLLMQAWISYWRWELARLAPLVEQIEPLLQENPANTAMLGELDFFRANLAYWQGDFETAEQLLEKALSQVGELGGIIEGNVEIMFALARCTNGKGEMAVQALNDRMRTLDPDDVMLLSHLVAALIFVHLISGELPPVRARAEQLTSIATRARMYNTAGWAPYFLGCACLHSFDLDGAIHAFAEAVRRPYVVEPRAVVDAFAGLAIAQQLAHRTEDAEQTLGRLMDFAVELNTPEHLSVAHACRARVSTLRGDLTSVVSWVTSSHETTELAELFTWLEAPAITRTRVLIATGSEPGLGEAAELLRTIRGRTESWGFRCQTIEATVLHALALQRLGRTDEAAEALTEAIAFAEPGGWIRPFVEAGSDMTGILRRMETNGAGDGFVQRVLAAMEPAVAAQPVRTPPSPAADPSPAPDQSDPDALTNREFDILLLLSQRLQNKEIADQLCISTHTVNDHLKHIYQKLDTKNRRQAVKRAVEMGILETP